MSHATGGPTADAKHAAISGRQVALIGAIAGLLAALVSIPVAIISADRANETALNTTLTQLSGETEKSQAEFLRAQRQTLYVKVIEHELALARAEADLHNLVYFYEPGKDKEQTVFKKNSRVMQMRASLENLDGASIEIIASDPVRVAFNALLRRHQALAPLAMKLYLEGLEASENPGDIKRRKAAEAVANRYDQQLQLLAADRQAFLEACRVDMGNR